MKFNQLRRIGFVLLWVCGFGLMGGPVPPATAQTNAPPAAPAAPVNGGDENGNGGEMNPPPPPAVASAVSPAPAAPEKEGLIEFDYSGAPVATVLEYYAKLTNRSIIAAPSLPGNITFHCQTKLTVEEAIQALDSVLSINGIAVIPLGDKFLKVVQNNTALPEGAPFGNAEKPQLPPADRLVSQIVPLKYADAAEVVGTLQLYKHTYGQVNALGKSNSILITDTAATINQLIEILNYMDQPSPLRMQTKVYIIVRAKAAEVVQRLQDVMQQTQQLGGRTTVTTGQPMPPVPGRIPFQPRGAAPGGTAPAEETVVEGKVIITADERTNKIFILSRDSNFPFFDQMIAELDAKVDPDVITKVIPLNYANADDIAGILNSLVGGGAAPVRRTTSTTSTGQPRPVVPPPPSMGQAGGGQGLEASGLLQFAEGVRILPDPRTNSLLVMATKQDMQRLEELIDSLDTAVAQVLIEVVIGEVTLNNELDIGVNLMKRLEKTGTVSSLGGTTTDGKLPTPVPDLSGLPIGAGMAALPQGLALSSALSYFATFRNLRLDAAIRLLSSTSNFRVLSTPIILTLHNQEADILVGESRPIITATLSGVTTVTSSNQAAGSFQSNVEYKDIAIELKVTPRINPDGFVTMDIDQKVNDIGGSVSISGNDQPIITKREAKSSVTVKDQSTIVLGGLIKEQNGLTESKVPFFGDIPLLGHLFKNKSNTKIRTELIVFIRPTVLHNDEQATAEAVRRSRMLKAGDKLGLEQILHDGRKLDTAPPAKAKPAATPPPPPADDPKPPAIEPAETPAPAK